MNPLNYVRLAGGFLFAIALGAAVLYFNHLRSEASKVPGLEQEVAQLQAVHARDDASAAKAALQIVANNAARAQADFDFQKWVDLKDGIMDQLRGIASHAPASTNTICLPSANERKLWNTAVAAATQSGH